MNQETFAALLLLLGWEHYERGLYDDTGTPNYDIYILRGVGFMARVKIQSNGQCIIWFDYGEKDFTGPIPEGVKFFQEVWTRYQDDKRSESEGGAPRNHCS